MSYDMGFWCHKSRYIMVGFSTANLHIILISCFMTWVATVHMFSVMTQVVHMHIHAHPHAHTHTHTCAVIHTHTHTHTCTVIHTHTLHAHTHSDILPVPHHPQTHTKCSLFDLKKHTHKNTDQPNIVIQNGQGNSCQNTPADSPKAPISQSLTPSTAASQEV